MEHCMEITAEDGRKVYQTFYADEMGTRLSEVNKTKGWQNPLKKIKVQVPEVDVKLNCWQQLVMKVLHLSKYLQTI